MITRVYGYTDYSAETRSGTMNYCVVFGLSLSVCLVVGISLEGFMHETSY